VCRKNHNTVLWKKHFFVTSNIYDFEMRNSEVKPSKSNVTGSMTSGRYVKVVPLQAWSGPEGSRKLRFPDFMTAAQDGG
jgi:hypothetical protein